MPITLGGEDDNDADEILANLDKPDTPSMPADDDDENDDEANNNASDDDEGDENEEKDDGNLAAKKEEVKENGPNAAVETTTKTNGADNEEEDQEALEKEAEEYLMTMKGRLEEFVMQAVPQKVTVRAKTGSIRSYPISYWDQLGFPKCHDLQLRRAVRCRVTRRDAGIFELRVERQTGPDVLLMTAKRRKKATTTTYLVYGGGPGSKGGVMELGGIKANILGTNYTVFRNRLLNHPRRRRTADVRNSSAPR